MLFKRHYTRLPNLPFLATCCVRLELRPLPSLGITRVQRYYWPLRRSLGPACPRGRPVGRAADHLGDLSRVASVFLLYACRRHYPGGTWTSPVSVDSL